MNSRKSGGSVIKRTDINTYHPITKNQGAAFDAWAKGQNLILSGSPGTGKTFLAMYFALQEVFEKQNEYDKIVLVRSIVPTREIGFLPGDEKEKQQAYAKPYLSLATEITGRDSAWNMMVSSKSIQFESTSFIRGVTFDDAIIVVDEMQNLNFHELDSVITRVGERCRMIFCGDYHQSDFQKQSEKNGILDFLEIIDHMRDFTIVRFGWEDIVRSNFVRDYIMTKEMIQEKKNEKSSNRRGS